MNIKTIIVGSLAVGLAIGGTLLKVTSQEKQSVYTPRNYTESYGTEEENERAEHAGYAEYLNLLRADPATGKIDYNLVEQVRNEVLARRKTQSKAALGLSWTQMGPDNVGGRTRAVLVDKYNINNVYAGSIGGGLFVSNDGSQHWTPVAGLQNTLGENLAISCITQTDNGRIFFGTGSSFESYTGGATSLGTPGFVGNGVYEYVPSTGQVLPVVTNTTAVPNNSTSSPLSEVDAIGAQGNRLYIGTKDGVLYADPDGSGFYPTALGSWTNPIEVAPGFPETSTCQDIDIASDGSIFVCFPGKAYVSNVGTLGTFTKITGISGGSRWSGAIAPSNPNVLYLLRSSGSLSGLHISLDKGATWSVIVPGGSACIDPFNQDDCTGGQGGYDDAIAVDPSDWGHVLVGGVQLYEWRYSSGSNPIGGSWLKAANLFESPFNPYYVHADKHTIVWPNASTIYIGSDGGVTRSVDGGASFQERNLGYNVTTFFDVEMAANGWFVGGAQDNGCQLFSFGSLGEITPLGTTEIQGGDGFAVAFSNQGPGVVYTTSQYGSLIRSSGGAGGTFYDAELNDVISAGGQPFNTCIENWENDWDFTSIDSVQVTFTGPDTLLAGQPFYYTSLSNGSQLSYTPSVTMFVDTTDTLMLQDYIQNRFAFATSKGIYLTRDAARLNAINPEWNRIANNQSGIGIPVDGLGSNVVCMEFSADGSSLFVGTTTGIKRIDGLNMANDSLGLDRRSPTNVITFQTGSGTSGVVTGIAADPNNVNNIIVTTGGYTTLNHVYKCTNAMGSLTCTSIQGSGATALPKMPVYDAEIDYNDNNKVIVGTEWGVWTTDNAFSGTAQWTDESTNDMAHVPVFAVEQQHLRSNSCINSGYLYLATHGRGFYTSPSLYTAVNENDPSLINKNSFVSNLSVYPNPISNTGVIAFDLNKAATTKVNIYNLSGALVKTMDLGSKAKGNHKVKFDVTSLSIGSYIISLESGSDRSVAKFIVTR